MILTVTPNTAVDRTYVLDKLDPSGINTPRVTLTTAGGKGVNVARLCSILGCQTVATGFVGGRTGGFIVDELERCGVLADFVQVSGDTRTCVEILQGDAATPALKINEAGPHVSMGDTTHLEAKVSGWLGKAELVVLSGSGTPGTPPDLYARIIERARDAGVRVILDASGEMLRQGVAATPFLVKPNTEELAALIGAPVRTVEEAAVAARLLLQSGIPTVAVSLGAQGLVLAQGTELLHAQAPSVDVVSTVGSGDCMVAGFALALTRGLPLSALARWGVAAGTANAAVLGAALCTRGEIEALLPEVKLTPLS